MHSYKTKYSQIALYVLLLIAVLVVMGMTHRCSNSNALSPVVKGNSPGDTLDIAVLYGPLSLYAYTDTISGNPVDTLGGLNYDLLSRMEKATGRAINLWPVSDLHDALDGLQKKKFDMLASLPADASVKEQFLTTKSVFLDRLVLVQKNDSDTIKMIKSALDLGHDTVYIEKGSPALTRLKNLSDEIGMSIPVKEVNLSEEYLCMKVATDEFPLTVVNEKTAERMEHRYPDLSYDNPVSFTQFQVWILPKSDTLLLQMTDKWLDEFMQTQEYKELIYRYKL